MLLRFRRRARAGRAGLRAKCGGRRVERLERRDLLSGESLVVVADYVDQYTTPTPAFGWQYLWNESGAFGSPAGYTALMQDAWRYRPTSANFPYLTATGAHSGPGVDQPESGGIDRYAIAAYTVGVAGHYEITGSSITRSGQFGDGVEVAIHVNDQPVTRLVSLAPASSGSFDTVLGDLSAGDTIYVGVGPDGPGAGSGSGNDGTSFDFSISLAQGSEEPVTVSIDLATQRFLGEVSALDRDKYFTHHSATTSDAQINAFRVEYDIERGRGFWGALPYAKNQTGEVGVYPNVTPSTDPSVRPVERVIHTGHPRDALRYDTDVQAAADWAVTYYTTVSDVVPEFYEPINEPFVHANDAEFADAPSHQAMRVKMAELYAAIGAAIDASPALADMKVVGYSSAWPSMELWDFDHWDSRMKMFMDVAGQYMDGFATHLYDGINVTGQNNRRSGSNSEAILDLIETYSFTKWGEVKPHAITEYGGIVSDYGDEYSDIKSAQSLRSQNHFLFNLLERENDLLISVPFNGDKATWFLTTPDCHPYDSALWRPTAPDGASCGSQFEYTWRVKLYELWQDVKGERAAISATDPDIQTQLFVDGDKAYVAVNNLADATQTLDLEFLSGLTGLQSVEIREMEIPVSGTPSYTETTQTTAPASLELDPGGTAILVYQFDAPIGFHKTATAEKYYTAQHLQAITAEQAISFDFSGVQTANEGEATLRMSIGRKHDRSKAPEVTVNGTEVDVPNDWKGYDQANRDDFFGMIEIPVPIELLAESNTVSVTFPDSGGRVSSMILAVETVEAVLPGDYDRDADVDADDLVFWSNAYGATSGSGLQADGNGDGVVDAADYTVWRDNLPVPAPAASTVEAEQPVVATASVTAAVVSDASLGQTSGLIWSPLAVAANPRTTAGPARGESTQSTRFEFAGDSQADRLLLLSTADGADAYRETPSPVERRSIGETASQGERFSIPRGAFEEAFAQV